MADGVNGLSSAGNILSNYEKYKDYFATNKNDQMGQDQFLMLMVQQMKNQDFTNPTDNSEYIAQMAQFSSVTQMQQVTYYTNATYATSLVGKKVSLGSFDFATGGVQKAEGIVSAVKLNGQDFEIVVGNKSYKLSEVMEVLAPDQTSKPTKPEDSKPGDDKPEDTTPPVDNDTESQTGNGVRMYKG